MEPTAASPGWYPDPWYAQSLRYWDGAAWTAYAQAAMAAPSFDATGIEAWGKRARVSFWIQGVTGAVASIALPLIAASFVHSFRDTIESGTEPSGPGGGVILGNLALQPLSLVNIVVTILIAVWSYRATETARSLGVTTTYTAGWAAASWFVPIANLWLPYQAVRDLVPPSDPARSRAGLWWALHLGTFAVALGSFAALFASTGLAVLVGAIGAVMYLWSAALGASLVDAATNAQLGAIAGSAAGPSL